MNRSDAWNDLGGGGHSDNDTDVRPADVPGRAHASTRSASRHMHQFDAMSGWCDCGQRDTGEICPFTPAADRSTANPAHKTPTMPEVAHGAR